MSESHAAFSGLPNPRKPLPRQWHGDVVSRLDAHAKHGPHAICLVGPAETWTYQQVSEGSYGLAKLIVDLGVRKGATILVVGARTPSLTVALLAIIRTGSAFCIVDPKYPISRLHEYARYVQPAGIIDLTNGSRIAEHLASFFPAERRPFCLEMPLSRGGLCRLGPIKTDRSFANATIAQNDPLYVSFTSGTTGHPKAVVGSHCPVSHFFEWQTSTFTITSKDRVSVLSGLAHDPLLRDVLMPLWVGASSWFPPEEAFQYPGRLMDWLSQSEITVVHLTPSLAEFILQTPSTSASPLCSSMRYAFFGGEILSCNLVRRFRRAAPGAGIVNCYGATETPQVVGYHIAEERPEESSNGTIPIGQGIEGCQLLVLDEENMQCPPEALGEICVRTPYLPLKIESTAEESSSCIKRNPFSNDPDDRVYRTGDLGAYSEDGTVVFRGRRDRQVKIRGFRVDLSEIESLIRLSPRIGAFDLSAQTDGNFTRLYLFACPNPPSRINAAAVRQELAESLPPFMVPDQIFIVPEMPLTPNGKVDRKTLMERTKIRTSERTLESGDPTTDRQILSILREVLQDFDSNIDFDSPIAGLDSLRSVELSCRIARQYGIELGISQLASCKTPAEIARLIARLSDQEDKGAFERALPESKGMAHAECTTDLRGPPPASSFLENPPRLIPKNERLLKAVLNRLLQLVARVAPDVWRVRLHKWRGVKIGRNVSIGYDSIIETSYPFLISIGDNVNIGMRATIIGHFRGMVDSSAGKPTVVIEDFAFIGPGVIVLPNTQIGRGAVIAAGSVVTRNIPAMTFAQGNPVRVVARCGIPLSGRATFKEFLEQLKPLP